MESAFEFEKPIAELERRIAQLRIASKTSGEKLTPQESLELSELEAKVSLLIEEIYGKLSPWQRVQLSRHPDRPYAIDYIPSLFEDFIELHGDRCFGDDAAILAGLGRFNGQSVAILAQQKGRNTKQKVERNFGMAKPEGYRKCQRMVDLANRFRLPLFTFIDTPGAFPGVDAEERGQSQAIAESILKMFELESPIITTIIGEGGSGGALAIGVADQVLMQAYSTYSVISPESCASILWADSSLQSKAAEIMKMLPEDLLALGVIDAIVPEPKGGAHRDFIEAANLLKKNLEKSLSEVPCDNIRISRFKKFRKIGQNGIKKRAISK